MNIYFSVAAVYLNRVLAVALILLALWLSGFSARAQNQLDGLGLGASPTATAAYGFRSLASAYTGPIVRLVRASDSEVRDVYLDVALAVSLTSPVSAAGGGGATATTLGDWIGASSASVSIWYDQSGNGRHASQANATQQPLLIVNGVLNTLGGRATLVTDGVNDQLSYTGAPANNFTLLTVAATAQTHQVDVPSTTGTAGAAGQRYLLGATQAGANAGQGLSVGVNGFSNYENVTATSLQRQCMRGA